MLQENITKAWQEGERYRPHALSELPEEALTAIMLKAVRGLGGSLYVTAMVPCPFCGQKTPVGRIPPWHNKTLQELLLLQSTVVLS